MLRTTRLRELRERAALSQDDLARLSGVARATVADLEASKRPARPSTLRKLAKALKVEVTELYEEADSPLGAAPPTQDKLFDNDAFEEREEERRAQLDEVGRFVDYARARAEYYERELERGRKGDYKTADAAYNLAVHCLEEFSSIDAWLFDHIADDLLVAMEEGAGVSPEIEEAYDALLGKLIGSTTRTQRALFDHARSQAKTERQRDAIAAKRKEAEALKDPRSFARGFERHAEAG